MVHKSAIDNKFHKKMTLTLNKDAIDVSVLKYDNARKQFDAIFPILCAAFPEERFGFDDDQPLPDVKTLSPTQIEELIDSCSGNFDKKFTKYY